MNYPFEHKWGRVCFCTKFYKFYAKSSAVIHRPPYRSKSNIQHKALRRLSSRFNGIGGFPRGDKGRIETSLVPPWKNNREEIILFNKTINTNAINKMVYIALSKRQISIYFPIITLYSPGGVPAIFLKNELK